MREIPFRIVCSRWNIRGLVERAVMADLAAAGLPLLRQSLSDLSDFGKVSLSGKVPLTGKVGGQVDRMVEELVVLGAVPAKPASRAA